MYMDRDAPKRLELAEDKVSGFRGVPEPVPIVISGFFGFLHPNPNP
jgi:hypothetical protein